MSAHRFVDVDYEPLPAVVDHTTAEEAREAVRQPPSRIIALLEEGHAP